MDGLLARFSEEASRLGFLVRRGFTSNEKIIERCREAARGKKGIIIPLSDLDLVSMLEQIAEGHRDMVDGRLEKLFEQIVA